MPAASSRAPAGVWAAPDVAVLPGPCASPTVPPPAPLQQTISPGSPSTPGERPFGPSVCPLPAVTPDEPMGTKSARKGRDENGSDCDAPRKHAQPAPNSSLSETPSDCDALPRPVQILAASDGTSQPSTAASTPQLAQQAAAAF
ncbi:uncharacterized protein LOC119385611 [Rhipicephalus sanguineus]|uniref:uncharacterized protein LOC119385611 n=1 Tax=Rhipicephalus sanguineus TaxID=34632 RepID=UPI00189569B8|nr:uncharacterized protein LOC119385611 [Rhipicephalus sanguineus]